MSNILIEKIRKARQTNVSIDRFTFTVRRPTDMEMLYFRGLKIREGDLLEKFVVGWDVKEIDIVPGGTDAAVVFDSALFVEWVADRSELWTPLCKSIIDLYRKHEQEAEDRLGKREGG